MSRETLWLSIPAVGLGLLWLALARADTFTGRPEDPRAPNAGWLQGPHPVGTVPFTNPVVLGAKGADGGMEYVRSMAGAIEVVDIAGSGGTSDTIAAINTTGATAHSDSLNLKNSIDTGLDDVLLHDYSSNTPSAPLNLIGKTLPGQPTSSSLFGVEHLATTAGSTYTLPTGAYLCKVANRGPNPVYLRPGGTPSTSAGERLAAFGGAATDPEDEKVFPIPLTVTAIGFITTTANQVTTQGVYITCLVR